MYGDPALWHDLCAQLAQISGAVPAGAGRGRRLRRPALRLVGGRAPLADYTASVQPHSAAAALAAVADLDVPRIHFGVGTGELLAVMGEAGADVVGVDYRVSLTDALARLGRYAGAGQPRPRAAVRAVGAARAAGPAIVDEGRAAPGHVFNLGHGVLPDTDPDVLTRVVDLVHEASAR